MDVCTPAGKIGRWTISKSFSMAAYRDARKANWGDLWALGAKTRVPRNLQLGGEKPRRRKSSNEQMMNKAKSIYKRMEEDKIADRKIEEEIEQAQKDEEQAILDEDEDADAAEVSREIEREDRQRKIESQGTKAAHRERSICW
jgi:ribosomal protein RSM22 (predicted rRNA methylase)